MLYLPPWRVELVHRPRVPRLVAGAVLARVLASALEAAGAPRPAAVGLTLSDDRELAGLNLEHMGQEGATDVLSFPLLMPSDFPPHRGARPAPRPTPASATVAGRVGVPGRVHLGDIVVSVERAMAQASEGRGGQAGDLAWSPADELRLLIVHGALHLCGWDHALPEEEAEMRALERRLLQPVRPVAR